MDIIFYVFIVDFVLTIIFLFVTIKKFDKTNKEMYDMLYDGKCQIYDMLLDSKYKENEIFNKLNLTIGVSNDELFNKFYPLIKSLKYNYSANNGETMAHLFNYKQKYIFILWQKNNEPIELSIHDVKDSKALYHVKADNEQSIKMIMSVVDVLGKFIADIRLNGNGESYSLKQGNLEGYQSGYLAGYLRGQEDSGKWNFPTSEEMFNDLKKTPGKINNLQK